MSNAMVTQKNHSKKATNMYLFASLNGDQCKGSNANTPHQLSDLTSDTFCYLSIL